MGLEGYSSQGGKELDMTEVTQYVATKNSFTIELVTCKISQNVACHYARILFPLEFYLLETIPLAVVIFGMDTDAVIYILVEVVFSFS